MADDEEENRFSARAARYLRVGTNVGAVAARVAGSRIFGYELDRSKNAAELAAALGGLKGPIMKAAQLLSTIPEALPPEYARELAQLQSAAPPMGPGFVRRRMRAELGADWESRFQNFAPEAAASASLGQVHRATAPDGRALAVKLQYPDMQSAVEADVNQLRVVFAIHARMDPAVDTGEILQEISARLREEIGSLRDEADRAKQAALASGAEPAVRMAQLREANEKLLIATIQAQTATEAAEGANRQKEQFLAMLAHELRNPLAPIVNALAILRRSTSENPTLTWVHDLIKRQVDHLTQLLNELLEVSRLTSGKVLLKKQPIE